MEPNKITDQLERRHRDRQLQIGAAQAERAQNSELTENLDYFLETFAQQATEITANIANLSLPEQPDQLTPAPAAIATRFDRIAKQLQQLQLYLSGSTLFLPDSVVKRQQRELAELSAQLELVKARLLPKKKFGFRSKPAAAAVPLVPEAVPNAEAAAARPAAAGATAASSAVTVTWTCKDRHDEEILLEDEQVNGKDLTMSTLRNCLVRIVGHPGSVQLSDIRDCLVLCGPVARSVFVDNCRDTVLAFGCQQFRLHTSSACQIYMHVTCRAIVEDCTAIEVAPYTYSYAGQEVDFAKAALDVQRNNWRDVADFNWLSADRRSPNWRELEVERREADWERTVAEWRLRLGGGGK